MTDTSHTGCCQSDKSGPCCKEVALPESPPTEADLDALSSLPIAELIARYRWGVEHFDPRLFHLSQAQLDQRFEPDPNNPSENLGLWSCRELVGHLADAEIAYAHRIRQTLAEDNPIFANWDEHAYIDSGIYTRTRPGGYVATIYTLRVWTGELLETLDEADLNRKGAHPTRGEFTLRRILEYATWHLQRHAWFLNKKIQSLAGPLPDRPEGPCCRENAEAENA